LEHLNTRLLSLADCDPDLRVVDGADDNLAPVMHVGNADPAMQNADGVPLFAESQGHGCVLGLQYEIGASGGVVPVPLPVAMRSPAGFGLAVVAAQLAAVRPARAMAVSGMDFASASGGACSVKCFCVQLLGGGVSKTAVVPP
jgi:hypothetical protein